MGDLYLMLSISSGIGILITLGLAFFYEKFKLLYLPAICLIMTVFFGVMTDNAYTTEDLNEFMDTEEVYSLDATNQAEDGLKPFRLMDINNDGKKYYIKGLYEGKKYIINVDKDLYSKIEDYTVTVNGTNGDYTERDLNSKDYRYELNLKLTDKKFQIDDLTYTKYEDLKPIKTGKK